MNFHIKPSLLIVIIPNLSQATTQLTVVILLGLLHTNIIRNNDHVEDEKVPTTIMMINYGSAQ